MATTSFVRMSRFAPVFLVRRSVRSLVCASKIVKKAREIAVKTQIRQPAASNQMIMIW